MGKNLQSYQHVVINTGEKSQTSKNSGFYIVNIGFNDGEMFAGYDETLYKETYKREKMFLRIGP